MRRTLSILALSMALFQGAQAVSPTPNNTLKDDEPVEVVFPDKGNVTFATVTKDGLTQMLPLSTAFPTGINLWQNGKGYYDIITSAEFTAPVTVCLEYNSSLSEDAPQLIHKASAGSNAEWADITLYTTDTGVCGEVITLSPFAVVTGFPYSMLLSSVRTNVHCKL
jgi:hypothetical protein